MAEFLTKEQILLSDQNNLAIVTVDDVPGLDGAIAMLPFTQKDRDGYDGWLINHKTGDGDSIDIRGMKNYVLCRHIIDPDTREPLFTEEELQGLSSRTTEYLWLKAAKMSGLAGGDVERAEKN